jgi:hypothetical protein
MENKIELEFEVDNPNEMRPVVLGSTNLLEDGPMASEEEIAEMFDRALNDIS